MIDNEIKVGDILLFEIGACKFCNYFMVIFDMFSW